MNRSVLVTFLSLTTLLSCHKDKVDTPLVIEDKVDYYRVFYMHYDPFAARFDSVQIQYSNGNIIKRVGGMVQLITIGNFFDSGIQESVTYSANQAIIVKSTNTPGYSFPPNERRFFFTGNKIDKCVVKDGTLPVDSSKYFYDNESIVLKKTYRNNALFSQSNFYYNSIKNIDSIVTRYSEYNPVTGTYEIDPTGMKRVKEGFENFDNYVNPAKKLVIFEETFNRSLSANNYKKYTKTKYDTPGTITAFEQTTWTFIYENGKINFAR